MSAVLAPTFVALVLATNYVSVALTLALASTSAAPDLEMPVSVGSTLATGSSTVPVSESCPLTSTIPPIVSCSDLICGNELTSSLTSWEGLPNVESIQFNPLPT